jgi:hypothetical protein
VVSVAREWTILIYMAGDSGVVFEGPVTGERLFEKLEGPMRADLDKVAAAGSSDKVAVCVQFDSLVEGQAFRWVVPQPDDPAPASPQPVGVVNTGEPGSLSCFVGWATERCPAERYALVIWGHGTGWDETRLYDRYPEARTPDSDRADLRGSLTRRGIFASTQARILAIEDDGDRALCYDDSSRDFLDNAELQTALCDAAGHLGKPKIELLGLDACLMSMLEVAYQIRAEVAYLLAGETVVPGNLWPWTEILQRLHEQPEMSPAGLAQAIAQELAAQPAEDDHTQAVLDLGRADEVAGLLDRWARLILDLYGDYYVRSAIRSPIWPTPGQEACLRFPLPGLEMSDYVDLFDLVRCFVEEWTGYDVDDFVAQPEEDVTAMSPQEELRWVSRRLLQRLWPGGQDSLVLHNLPVGLTYEGKAHGVSIYAPQLDDPCRDRASQEISPQYGNLTFSDTAWPELVCKLHGLDELPAGFVAVRERRRSG